MARQRLQGVGYGGIYIDDGNVQQLIDIAPSPLINWKSNFPSSVDVISDFANNRVTVHSAGDYEIVLSVSGQFLAARILYLHVAVNGAVAAMGGLKRGGSGGVVPTVGGSANGILTLAKGDVVNVLASTDVDQQALVVLEASLSLMKKYAT